MSFPLHDGWSESDVEAVIARDDPRELLYVPIVVSLDPPARIWSERICIRLSSHRDAQVRGNAVLGFGHLARSIGYLRRSVVKPIIEAALVDPELVVRQQADCAADDVEWFLGWILRGREAYRFRGTCPRTRHRDEIT